MAVTIGINTFVWYSPLTDSELQQIVPKVANWGFEVIELVLENPGDWTPELAAQLTQEYGITPAVSAVMAPGRNLVDAPDDEVKATQDYLVHCVDVAAQIGARIVGGPIYTEVGKTWRTTPAERTAMIADLREAMRPIADAAGEAGVTLAIEPLNRYETSVINTVEQMMELLDDLPTSAGLLFDTYHANIEEADPVAALRDAGPRLEAMQVCSNTRGAPGDDHIDWDGYGRVLAEIGYEGAMSIESFTSENEIIATAASIWRTLAPSQDQLATDGLAFLKAWRDSWVR